MPPFLLKVHFLLKGFIFQTANDIQVSKALLPIPNVGVSKIYLFKESNKK